MAHERKQDKKSKNKEERVKDALVDGRKTIERAIESAEAVEARAKQLVEHMVKAKMALEVRKRMSPEDLRAAVYGLFEAYNFSPLEEIILMLKDPSNPFFITCPKLRASVLFDLNSYMMPKLKTVESNHKHDHTHTVIIKRYGDDGVVTREKKPALEVPVTVKRELAPIEEGQIKPGQEVTAERMVPSGD